MKRRKHRARFWKAWHEAQQSSCNGTHAGEFDPHREWHRHFANFLGQAPEKHWLFGGRRFKPWAKGTWGPPSLFNPFVADLMSKGGGLLPLFVLHLLAEKPRYGNDVMREIEERTHGRWGPNPGAIYPLLAVMEQGGLVVGEWEDPDKRTRRVYRLTPEGQQELERLKEVMRPKLEEAINVLRELHEDLDLDEEE